MPISDEAERLANIDALIAEWKRTPKDDTATRARIASEMNCAFPGRDMWQKKHKASYNFGLATGVVKRVRAPNGTPLWFKKEKEESRIGVIAKYRDELHHRMRGIPGGMAIEREAGDYLRQCNNAELPVEVCIQRTEQRVQQLLGCMA